MPSYLTFCSVFFCFKLNCCCYIVLNLKFLMYQLILLLSSCFFFFKNRTSHNGKLIHTCDHDHLYLSAALYNSVAGKAMRSFLAKAEHCQYQYTFSSEQLLYRYRRADAIRYTYTFEELWK